MTPVGVFVGILARYSGNFVCLVRKATGEVKGLKPREPLWTHEVSLHQREAPAGEGGRFKSNAGDQASLTTRKAG